MNIDKLLTIILFTALILIVIGIFMTIRYTIKDYQCSTLSPYEFYQNEYCIKNWRKLYEEKED